MLLTDYLNKNYSATGFWSVADLVTNFMDTFGVSVKNEKDLFLFKYDMLAAKWVFEPVKSSVKVEKNNDGVTVKFLDLGEEELPPPPLTRECRGVILRKAGTWEVCSRPWDKFFNAHEGHSGVHTEELFTNWVAASNPYLSQKVDGTAIQLWYDKAFKRWTCSTLGTITPSNVGDYNFTFSDLFWKVLNGTTMNFETLRTEEIQQCTVLMELCTVYNRILTKYPVDTIFLISVRNNVTGQYWDNAKLKALSEALVIQMPHQCAFRDLGLKTLEDTVKFVEDAAKDNAKYGEYSEGFVAYSNGTPVAKFKNNTYLSLHHLSGGDTAHTKNVVIEAFFTASIDDMMKVLTDPMKDYVENIRVWYIAKCREIFDYVKVIQEGTYSTQKDYALAVQKVVSDKALMSIFFSLKEKIINKSFCQEDINEGFKKNWLKYEDILKKIGSTMPEFQVEKV